MAESIATNRKIIKFKMAAIFNNVEWISEEKRNLIINKWYAKSLSNDKLIYARDEDPEESIIIRSVYPNINYWVFGIKDVINIVLFTGLVADAGELRRLSCSQDDFIYFLPVAATSLRAGFQVYLSKLWVVDVTKEVRYDLLIYCLLSDVIFGNNHLCEAECWGSVSRVKLQSESQVLAHR